MTAQGASRLTTACVQHVADLYTPICTRHSLVTIYVGSASCACWLLTSNAAGDDHLAMLAVFQQGVGRPHAVEDTINIG